MILFVLGPTGCGKTDLAISLANSLIAASDENVVGNNGDKLFTHAEIINCDVLQMYAGLPIVTNKIQPHENPFNIPHHLLGFHDPLNDGVANEDYGKVNEDYGKVNEVDGKVNEVDGKVNEVDGKVNEGSSCCPLDIRQFVEKAMTIISQVLSRRALPIIVGGTHYYVQHLIFETDIGKANVTCTSETNHDDLNIRALSAKDLYERLEKLDPLAASKFHQNDKRRLENAYRNALARSKGQDVPFAAGYNRLRYPGKTIVYCLYPESMSALDVRLDGRVEKMLELGLLDELQSFWTQIMEKNQGCESLDTSKGIFQAIGFKDWIPYLKVWWQTCIAEEAMNNPMNNSDMEEIKKSCIESMQFYTRKYARRQIKWIRSQITSRTDLMTDIRAWRASSDPETWLTETINPAIDHLKSLSSSSSNHRNTRPSVNNLPAILTSLQCLQSMQKDQIKRQSCPICPEIFIYGDESALLKHNQSRKHRMRTKKLSRRKLLDDGTKVA